MIIVVERPTEADIEPLRALYSLTIRETFRREGIDICCAEEIDREIINQMDVLRRDFASNGQQECVLIARSGGRVVGAIACGRANSLIVKHAGIAAQSPEVKGAYVLPEYQGKGIGTALLRQILSRLRDQGVEDFCLDSGYREARKYWTRKLGEPLAVLQDQYGPGAHHMIWRCNVADALKRVSRQEM